MHSIAWHINNQRMVPSIFRKLIKTKSFAAPDDKRSIFVFEVIILVQASSLFGYRKLFERVAQIHFCHDCHIQRSEELGSNLDYFI